MICGKEKRNTYADVDFVLLMRVHDCGYVDVGLRLRRIVCDVGWWQQVEQRPG